MINEAIEIKNNAQKVSNCKTPNIPILMFSSNGIGTGFDEKTWRKIQKEYSHNCTNGELINLDCSHYVHDYEYKKISEEIKKFLNKN